MVKRCLVLGSANCVRDDIERALDMAEFDCVVACKGAGLIWGGKLDAWVSLHPERLPADIVARRRLGFPDADRTYGHKPMPGVSHSLWYKWEKQKRSGSSGLFACRVAQVEFGCDRLVLCGIPLQKEAGRIDGKERWNGAQSFKQGFIEALPYIQNTARSMSGWTRTHLGYPTRDWLEYNVG